MQKYLTLLDHLFKESFSLENPLLLANLKKILTDNYNAFLKDKEKLQKVHKDEITKSNAKINDFSLELQKYTDIINSEISASKLIAKSIISNISTKESFSIIELEQEYEAEYQNINAQKKVLEEKIKKNLNKAKEYNHYIDKEFAENTDNIFKLFEKDKNHDSILFALNNEYRFTLSKEINDFLVSEQNYKQQQKKALKKINDKILFQQELYSQKVLSYNQFIKENRKKLNKEIKNIEKHISQYISDLDERQNAVINNLNTKKAIVQKDNEIKTQEIEEKIKNIRNEKAKKLLEIQNETGDSYNLSVQKLEKETNSAIKALNADIMREEEIYRIKGNILREEESYYLTLYTKTKEYRFILLEYLKEIHRLQINKRNNEKEKTVFLQKNDKEHLENLFNAESEFFLKELNYEHKKDQEKLKNYYNNLKMKVSHKKNDYLFSIEKKEIHHFLEMAKIDAIKKYHQEKRFTLTSLANLALEKEINFLNNELLILNEEKIIRLNILKKEFNHLKVRIENRYNNLIALKNKQIDELKLRCEHAINDNKYYLEETVLNLNYQFLNLEKKLFSDNQQSLMTCFDRYSNDDLISLTSFFMNLFTFSANNYLKSLILANTTKINEISSAKFGPLLNEINIFYKSEKDIIKRRRENAQNELDGMLLNLNQIIYLNSLLRNEIKNHKDKITTLERLNMHNQKSVFSAEEKHELITLNNNKIGELTQIINKKLPQIKDNQLLISQQEHDINLQNSLLAAIIKEESDLLKKYTKEIFLFEGQKRNNAQIYYNAISHLKEHFKSTYLFYKKKILKLSAAFDFEDIQKYLQDLYQNFSNALTEETEKLLKEIEIYEKKNSLLIFQSASKKNKRNLEILKRMGETDSEIFQKKLLNNELHNANELKLENSHFQTISVEAKKNREKIIKNYHIHKKAYDKHLKSYSYRLIDKALQIDSNKLAFSIANQRKNVEIIEKKIELPRIKPINYNAINIKFANQTKALKKSYQLRVKENKEQYLQEKKTMAQKAISFRLSLKILEKNYKREIALLNEELKSFN